METREKHKLLDCIGEVYEKAKNCELKEGFFTEQKAELNILSDYFGTTKSQSFFIAIVFTLNYKGDTVDLNDMIEYFGCNPMKLLEFNEDFNYLQSKAYLKKKLSKHRVQVAGANNQFTVNEKLCEAILKNEPVPELKNAISDIFELLEEICELGKQRDNDEINTLGLYKLVIKLLEEHKELTLIQKIEPFELSVDDKLLYFYLIWKTITGRETCNVERALEAFFDRETKRVYYMQDLVDGNNALLEHKLIEVIPTKFLNNTEIILTETSNVLLKECGITVSRSKKNKDNIWSPADIQKRKLIIMSIDEAFKFGLSMKEHMMNKNSYVQYKSRIGLFEKWLRQEKIFDNPITSITKKTVNQYLNTIVKKTSARNRNNSRTDIASLFQLLEERLGRFH